jgi:EAL domain-containing protein (putative c-di-GMP-specific phosphodiesterase class I)
LGIDHFGLGLLHFGYLKSLLPDYVKIDRGITQDLWNEQGDSYFFVNALCNVAHSLDIRVMVEGVETEQQWRAISRIHLDAVQGFLIQRPEPLQPGPEDHNISLTIS